MSWQDSSGARWRDGEFGWLHFKTLGGPFHGVKYKWGCIGPSGEVPYRLMIPLKQPGHLSPKARYVRVGDPLREEGTGIKYYEFLFEGHVGPDNFEVLADATAAIEDMLHLAARAQRAEAGSAS